MSYKDPNYQKKYQEEHKEEIFKQHKEWCKKNGDKILKYRIKYKKNHKKQIPIYQKEYQDKNKLEISKQRKEYRIKNKQIILERDKKYYESHKEEISLKQREYYFKNQEKFKKRRRKQYLKHKDKYIAKSKKRAKTHKEEIKKYKKEYYQKNREKINKYFKNRRKKNLNYRLIQYLRSRLWEVLKGKNKSEHTFKLLGCSIEFLKKYIESKFKQGMDWNNYGRGWNGKKQWHVDHIRPCANFDLSKPSEQRKCFHYTNLQPLWALENLRKNKY